MCLCFSQHKNPSLRSAAKSWKIRFIMLQNRQGKTRLAKYYVPLEDSEKHKVKYEVEVVKFCSLEDVLVMVFNHLEFLTLRHSISLQVSQMEFFNLHREIGCAQAHPYLLADNRHYPFYLWRKVIMAHWSIRYLLVPIYMYSWLSIIHAIGRLSGKGGKTKFAIENASKTLRLPILFATEFWDHQQERCIPN